MKLYVIGVNYKKTPLQIREKFSIENDEYEKVLSSFKLLDGVSECALLSTCNRTELHIFSENGISDTGHLEQYLCDLKGLDIYTIKKYFYVYEGTGAIQHIMKVASGMDSMILGEDQILGQFKKAYELSMRYGTSKAVLNTLSRLAITSSKKIQTRNQLLGKAVSVAGQVENLLSSLFKEDVTRKKVLIIGSGEIAKMVSERLVTMGLENIYMTKRSSVSKPFTDKAQAVRMISYNDRYSCIDECDIVIGATSSPHYTVTQDILKETLSDPEKSRIFIDLAVPRDFDETLSGMKSIRLYNIDDLKSFSGSAPKDSRPLDNEYINRQINSHMKEFMRWFDYRKKSIKLSWRAQ
jgi:glutamyl-tRNA reductase